MVKEVLGEFVCTQSSLTAVLWSYDSLKFRQDVLLLKS